MKQGMKRFVRLVTAEPGVVPDESHLTEIGLQPIRRINRDDTSSWYATGSDETWSKRLPGYRVESLPLEDVFVELSGKALVDL